MAKRFNPGKSDNLSVLFDALEYNNTKSSALEFWSIYDRGAKDGFTRWKLCAAEGTSVLGKANYALVIKDGVLWTKDGGGDLQAERPELFTIVSNLAAGQPAPQESLASDEEDPYGDLALSRGRKLVQLQLWNRALLKMRETELHWECRPDRDNLPEGVVRAPSWELGVRQAWFGIFRDDWSACLEAHKKSIAADARDMGTLNVDTGKIRPNWNAAIFNLAMHLTKDMPEQMLDDALAFISRRGEGAMSFEAYKEVLRHFHDGDYKPESCRVLADQFDLISGWEGPTNLEVARAAFDSAMDLL